jgi:enoyl-CoA hydratase/carnithine racemase
VDAPELIIDTPEAGIATFVLNRPAELNAWTYPLEESFFYALDSAAADPAVRVVVVTGAGRGFCAGASMQLLGDGDRSKRPDRARRRRLCELAEFPKPAAIKRQLLDADHPTLPEAYEQAADLMEPALVSADHREGVQAFRERRPPRFAPLLGGAR